MKHKKLEETKTHELYKIALRDKEMFPIIAYGTAGTGKTYSAVGAAVDWLDKGKNQKVLVTRPNVSFADTLGFLAGSEREKIEPWVRPISQAFSGFGIHKSAQNNLERTGRLTYLPLEHVQGLTFDNTFIILDEVQNMTFSQLKVFLTRIGSWSKVVLCGDVAQTSAHFKGSGLQELINMVEYMNLDVHVINFTRDDVLRSTQCKAWITSFEDWEGL